MAVDDVHRRDAEKKGKVQKGVCKARTIRHTSDWRAEEAEGSVGLAPRRTTGY